MPVTASITVTMIIAFGKKLPYDFPDYILRIKLNQEFLEFFDESFFHLY